MTMREHHEKWTTDDMMGGMIDGTSIFSTAGTAQQCSSPEAGNIN